MTKKSLLVYSIACLLLFSQKKISLLLFMWNSQLNRLLHLWWRKSTGLTAPTILITWGIYPCKQYTLRIVPEYSLFLLDEPQVILTHNHSPSDTFIVTKNSVLLCFFLFLISEKSNKCYLLLKDMYHVGRLAERQAIWKGLVLCPLSFK